MRYSSVILSVLSASVLAGVVGCGETAKEKQDKNFFTSGNREADQRADQQMAKQEQLSGDTNNGGLSHAGNAVVATGKKSLYDNLGGADGISAIVDDFLTRALSDPRGELEPHRNHQGRLQPPAPRRQRNLGRYAQRAQGVEDAHGPVPGLSHR